MEGMLKLQVALSERRSSLLLIVRDLSAHIAAVNQKAVPSGWFYNSSVCSSTVGSKFIDALQRAYVALPEASIKHPNLSQLYTNVDVKSDDELKVFAENIICVAGEVLKVIEVQYQTLSQTCFNAAIASVQKK